MAALSTDRSPRPKLLVEELETRILYSADAAALLGLADAAQVRVVEPATPDPAHAQAVGTAGVQLQARELVFVDSRVPDAIALADELIRQRGGGHLFDIVLLQADRDGVAQISEVLAGERNLAAIHIISHGSDGAIEIGDGRLDAERLAVDGAAVAAWGEALATGADLLLYGCQVAEDVAGRAFVQQLALLTGADVAASTDITGTALPGANWNLEYATGSIEASQAAESVRMVEWQGVLATVPGTAIFRDSGSGTTPQTNRWDGTGFGGATATTAAGGWKIVEAVEAPTRNEIIAIGIDNDKLIKAQIWNGTAWAPLLGITGTASASTYHSFDIAYDEASGDAMVVWNDANQLNYSIWNGSSWTPRATVAAYTGAEPLEIRLAAKPGGGEMVVVVSDASRNSQALVWDGSSWGSRQALGTASSSLPIVGVAYEQTSGAAMVIHGDGASADAYYRRWTAGAWSAQQTLTAPAGISSSVHWTQVATDASPGSNRIAVGFVTNTPKTWFAVWDGSAWGSADKLVAAGLAPNATSLTVDVAFEHDSGALIAAHARSGTGEVQVNRWTAAGGWGTQQVAAALGSEPNSIRLDAAPGGNAVMLLAQNATSALSSTLWDGSAWGAPVQLTVNTTQTKNQPFAFAWDRQPVPTELTVDTTSDVADGNTASISALLSNRGADGRISLREAILATNNSVNRGTPDTIRFDIADALVGGAHTIRPTSALPMISEALVIDATTEPDYAGMPVVEIDGSLAGGAAGALGSIGLQVSGGGSTIKGLAINQFSGAGIRLDGSGNNLLQSNHIGTDVTGLLDRGNGWYGVYVLTVGNNTIGGNLAAQGNLISGNEGHGIVLGLSGATGNQVLNNRIGTTADGIGALGNSGSGILFSGSVASPVNGNQIGNNTIAWNGGKGITLTVGSGNSLLGNRIHSNSGLGIDLGDDGVTANDAGDADSGSNGLQNFPLLTNASTNGSQVRISGTLGSAALRSYRIEFFSSAAADPSGHGEGRTFLGSTTVATDAGGNASFDASFAMAVAVGEAISATATDSVNGDTSEFAASFVAIASAPPVVTLPGPPAGYTENAPAIVVDAGATVSDIDSADFSGGTLTIDLSANGTADDRLGIRNEGTGAGQIGVAGSSVSHGGIVIGSFAGGNGAAPLVISLNANATPAATQQLLRSITFENTSDNPSTASRTLRVVLADGDGGSSAPVTKTITLTAVNDAPTVTAGGTLAYTENQAATPVDPSLTLGDVDSATLASASVAITAGYASGQDSLEFATQNGITGSWDAGAGVLTLSGTATLADYQAALRSVAYLNTSDNPSIAARSVRFAVHDGSAASSPASATVSVTAVNDAPLASNLNAAQTYTEDSPLALTPIVISDVDSSSVSATLTLSNPAAGRLNTGTAGSVSSSYDVATGTWSASGATADVNALLAALVFTPTADHNASFSIATAVSDGVAPAITGSKPMSGVALNDAPVVDTSNSTRAYPIGTPAVAVDSGLTLSDVDHTQLAGASVSIVGGYVSGRDQLAFTDQPGIIGNWIAASGTLNLSGNATVAQYQAALRTVTFQTSSTVSGARLIAFTASDGTANSLAALRSLTVGQEVPALWLSSTGDSTTSAGTGGLKYDDGQVARLANPNLSLGAGTSNGSFTGVFDIDGFAAGNANINGLHVVHAPVTVGSVNPISLQRGDVLLSMKSGETLGGVAVSARDIALFRPTTAGDYSSGSFSVLLRDPLNGVDLRDFALVETPMTIGSTSLLAGEFLLVGSGGSYDKDVSLFRPATISAGRTTGTLSVLVDGDSSSGIDFNKQIYGLELVQHDTRLGGVALQQGQLLVSVNGSATVGGNNLAVDGWDVFVLTVTATGHATSVGTAAMLMRGSDLGLTGGSEELDAIALVGVYNTAPVLDVTRSPMLAPIREDSGAPSGPVGTLVSSLVDFTLPAGQHDNVTDPDTDAQLGIAVIVADTSAGSWWYSIDNGSNWSALGPVSNAIAKLLAADAGTRLYFQPNPDFAGTLSSAITFRAWDRTVGSNGQDYSTAANGGASAFSAGFDTASLVVTPSNDAPRRISPAPAPIVADEDSAPGGASLGLGGLSYAPGGGTDEAGQTLTAQITSIPAAVTLWLADGITAVPLGSTLTIAQLQGLMYRTVADANGNALLAWTIRDSGGTADGGNDSLPDSLSITINPVQDAPVLTGSNELDGINQNAASNPGTLVAELIAGHLSDPDAGALTGIAVVGVDDANGSWQYSRDGGTSWTAFGTPSASSARLLAADAGSYVRFVPNSNWVGQVAPGLSFRAWDQTSGIAGQTGDTTLSGGSSAFSSATASAAIQVHAWPVIFTGSYLENFSALGTGGNQMAIGYRALTIAGNTTSYGSGTPINAAGIASATIGNQNLLVWKQGDPNILSTNRIANAGSIGNVNDRTLATGPTGNAATVIELAMRNGTPGALASIQFGYDMKVLATGEDNRTENGERPGFAFFYSLTGGSSASEWIGVPALATTSTAVGSVTSVSARIDFATPLAAGATMYFRWADDNADDLSPDQNFAIDNVSVQRINTAPVLSTVEPSALGWQEDGAAAPVSTTISVADVDDAALTGATVTISANYAADQDRLAFADQNGITGSWDGATGVLTLTGGSSLANYQTALRSVAYLNTSDAPSILTRTVSFSVRDAASSSNVVSRMVEVTARNDAPVLTGSNDLPSINRNAATNAGLLVADLLTGHVVDPDAAGAARGIAVVGVDDSNGSWQYSMDGGTTWVGFGTPSSATARLLAADAATRVRFAGAADWSGSVSGGLRFQAWDQSSGSAGSTADARFNGGSSAFSSAMAAASITVRADNSAPVLGGANALTPIAEDAAGHAGTLVASLVAGRISDADPGALFGIAVTGVDNSNGNWQYSLDGGTSWADFGAPSSGNARLLAADAASFVRFVPTADFNGTLGAGITFHAWDRSSGVPGDTTDLRSLATVRDEFGSVSYSNNDGSERWSTSWLDVDAGPTGGGYRITGGQLQIKTNNTTDTLTRQVDLFGATSATLSFDYVSDLDAGTGGRVDMQLSNDGGASYTSIASFTPALRTGSGSFSADITAWVGTNTRIRFATLGNSPGQTLLVDNLQVAWNSSGGGSTAYSSASASAAITVDPVNDAPVRSSPAPAPILAAEDSSNLTPVSLGLSGLTYGTGGGPDEAGQTLTYTLTSIPSSVTLWLADGTTAVPAGTTLTLTQLRGLGYRTVADANGSANLVWSVVDDGGTARGGVDTLTDSVSITITPVNDAPVTSAGGGSRVYSENQAAIAVDPALAVSDIDSAVLASATVAITGNFGAGEDRLVLSNQNGISGSFDAGTGVLSLSGVSSVANYQAALRSVAYLNTSDDPSGLDRTVSFSVNDGALTSNLVTTTVRVTPVNDAPVATAGGAALGYVENQPATAIDPAISLVDLDNTTLASASVRIAGNFASGEDRLVFSNQNGISGSFNAASGVLSLSGVSSVANYQAALRSVAYLNTSDDPSGLDRTVSFSVSDGALTSNLATTTVSVTPVNDAPVATAGGAALGHVENQPATAIDPALSLSDLDNTTLAAATVRISGNFASGQDRLVFSNQNGISGSFDAGTGVLSLSGVSSVANYQAALRSVAYLNTSDDPSGLDRTVSFSVNDGALTSNLVTTTVRVTPVNDAPVATAGGGSLSYVENQPATAIDPAITLADVDNTTLASASVAITGNFASGEDRLVFSNQNGISGSFNAASGVLSLSGVSSLANYQAALRSVAYLNTSDDPSGLDRTVSFSISDGALTSNLVTTTVRVTPVNDAPVAIAGGGSLSYVENQPATAIDPAITLADLDNTTLASASVAITGNFASGEDRLVFSNQNGISGSFDAGTGVLSLSGVSSVANYQAALRSVAYLNTSDDPSGLDRTVSFSVNDGALTSNLVTTTVRVTPVNDAPVATAGGAALGYVENQPATAIDPAISLVDLDNTTLASASVRIAGNFASGEDRLVFSNQNGISGSFNAASGVLSLSGVSSVANYQAALRSVAYLNTSDDPSGLDRTVSFSVNDGALTSNLATTTVSVTPVNDAPVATAGGAALGHVENQPATAIDPALSLSDLDNTTLASATVRISGNFASGQDRLVFSNQNGISGSFDAGTGVLSLSGVSSVANYQAALRSVAYLNTSDDPSGLDRTVSFSVNDGALTSNLVTTTVRVTPVNDAPVATAGGGSLSYVENQPATAIDPAITLADVDNTTLASASVAITGNFASGEDRLVFSNQNGISGSFNAASGVLSLSGVSSVANYQAALRSVAYLNTSDDPSGLDRTVSFSVNDGALTSDLVTTTVRVAPVNDAPVVATSGGSLAYVENQPAAPIDPALVLGDFDNTTLTSAIVSIGTNYLAGEDRLVFADQNGITGSWNGATGVLSLSGSASLSNYQAALRSIAYVNSSDDPSPLTRVVSFQVSDGALASNLDSRTVTVSPVNDAPVIAAGGATPPAYVENQPAVIIDPALTLGDLDDAMLASARVAITGNFAAGEDHLVFSNQNGISGSYDVGTGVLSLSGVSSIGNYQAALRSVAYLNSSEDPSGLDRTVSFSVNDGGLSSNLVTTPVKVAPVNDAPVTASSGGSLAFVENQPAASVDPGLMLSDPDHTTLVAASVRIDGNFIAGEDRLVFADQNGISGRFDGLTGELRLAGGASLAQYQAALRSVAYLNTSDDPSALTRTVSFSVNDGALWSNLATRDVSVAPVNDAPVVTTSGAPLVYVENQGPALVDAAIVLADVDDGMLTLATVAITGNFAAGEDQLVFSDQNGISGRFDATTGVLSLAGSASVADYQRALRSVAYLNVSDDPSQLMRTLSISASDAALVSAIGLVDINIVAVNDAPVAIAGGGSLAYVENQPATAIDPAISLADVDNTTLASASVKITGNFASGEDRLVFSNQNGISGSFDAASGVLSLSGVASVADYQAALRSVAYLNTSDDPSGLDRTVSFSVNDGALTSNLVTTTVSVTPVNDAPVATAGGAALGYVENQPATAIDPALSLSDLDNTTLASATVRISGNFASGEDRLVFSNQNGISGSFNTASGVLSLSGVSSVANYQAALRSVAYLNTSDDPSGLDRTVSFSVNDGALTSNFVTTTVRVTPVNDATVAAAGGGSLSHVENQPAIAIDPAISLADVDNTTLASASVAITGNFASGEDRLVFSNQNGISGSFDAATGVLSLSGVSSVANYQAALRSVAYLNTSDDPSGLDRTVSFSVNDGALTSNLVTTTVRVTPVNDAPVATAGGGSLAYVENQPATAIDPAITLADLDNTTLASASVAITGNFASGEDRLVFSNQNGISGSFNAASGVLSLSGVSSVANYQAALRSVAYLNASDDPSGLDRTVSFSVNDGALTSNLVTTTVRVTPVNDAPVATAGGGSLSYVENQPATAIDPAITLADLDNTTLASASVAITGNFASGEDRLVFSNQNGISGSFDAGTGVLSLSGVSSVANYQAALRSVAYLNTSDDPSGLDRTVSFSVNDGALTSNLVTTTVRVTPVNDAPVATAGDGSLSYGENQPASAIDPAITLADLDNTTLAAASVTITGNFASGEDRLVFSNQNGISGSFDAASGVLSLSGVSSVANYQSALRSVAYLNTSDDPSGLDRTVSFSVSDGALTSNLVTTTVRVTPINDAPVATAGGAALGYVENQPATAIDPALSLSDLDNTTLASATVRISGNFASGEDRLVFSTQNGISGSFDAASGVLSLSGVSSVANYQAALRSVAYLNTSDDPSGLDRTVSFSVNDGALTSNLVDTTVRVTPVNDAPSTGTVILAPIAEDSGARIITQAELLAAAGDAESQDLRAEGLALASGSGTLQDNGNGSWTYTPAADDDSEVAFSYQVTDGSLVAAGRATMDLTPVDDAPLLAVGTLQVQGGGSLPIETAMLQASDIDNAVAMLDFVVLDVSHGRFESTSTPGISLERFSQADVNAGRIVLVSTSATQAPSFRIAAWDGNSYSGEVTARIDFRRTALSASNGDSVGGTAAPGPRVPVLLLDSSIDPTDADAGSAQKSISSADRARTAARAKAAEIVIASMATLETDAALDQGLERRQNGRGDSGEQARTRRAGGSSDAQLDLATLLRIDDFAIDRAEFELLDLSQQQRSGSGRGINADIRDEASGTDGDGRGALDLGQAAAASGLVLSAGTIWWALRAGSLLTGLMVSLPAWRHADLLAVLPDEEDEDVWDSAEDNESARDERAVDRIFESGASEDRR